MTAVVEAFGVIGSVVSLVMFIPQATRTWRFRRQPEALTGTSRIGMVLVLVNALAWAGYGIGTAAYWTAIPSACNAPLALGVLWLLRARRSGHTSQSDRQEVRHAQRQPDQRAEDGRALGEA
ncbi:hypothetical protein ACFVJS_15840 [Nocardioides sp. NPDC057772]|uniref:hypothetical protein n=1 Tax=Nocardioides sp. NPDC057772 TaxID=3346245 RepID=UPI00366BCBFE